MKKMIVIAAMFVSASAFSELEELPANEHSVGTCPAIITATAQNRLERPENQNLVIRTFDVRETEPGDYVRKVHYRAYFQYEVEESATRKVMVTGYDAYDIHCSLLGTIIHDRKPIVIEN